MRICIPCLRGTGLDDEICGHFGSAPYFAVCNTENDEITVVPNDNAHHAHGTCHPLSRLENHRLDAVVVQGMGHRALATMRSRGLRVLRATQPTVRATLEGVRRDALPEYTLSHACGGHGHGHRHGHGPGALNPRSPRPGNR